MAGGILLCKISSAILNYVKIQTVYDKTLRHVLRHVFVSLLGQMPILCGLAVMPKNAVFMPLKHKKSP